MVNSVLYGTHLGHPLPISRRLETIWGMITHRISPGSPNCVEHNVVMWAMHMVYEDKSKGGNEITCRNFREMTY